MALGARFDDRVTGKLDTFAPAAKIVHADIDPAEIGKNRAADVPIVGDARHVIDELVTAVRAEQEAGRPADLTEWWAHLDDLRERYPLGWEEPSDGTLAPQYVIKRLGEIAGPDGDLRRRRGPAPDVGHASSSPTSSRGPGSTPAAWAPWATRCRRRWGRRSASRRPRSGRSTATAASR